MKTISPALSAFLASQRNFVMADLYTFSLVGGLVYRCTDAELPQQDMDGNYYAPARITRNGIRLTTGVEVSELECGLFAGLADLINGQPIIPFIVAGGFDNAVLTVHRAFKANWQSALVGTVSLFSGRVSQPRNATRTSVSIVAKCWLELLNVNVPSNVYQPSCKNVLYDQNCLADPDDFIISSSAETGSTDRVIQTPLAQAAGYFDLGKMTFTSGANAGISRTVKRQIGDGTVTVVLPFPQAPANGDTFTILPGCDRRQATCSGKFNNLPHFRGFPYVPVPETSV